MQIFYAMRSLRSTINMHVLLNFVEVLSRKSKKSLRIHEFWDIFET